VIDVENFMFRAVISPDAPASALASVPCSGSSFWSTGFRSTAAAFQRYEAAMTAGAGHPATPMVPDADARNAVLASRVKIPQPRDPWLA
jgi:hypothetical protein